jgi:ubiquinone/menaquinone biosynthesis C-methylase UbiE
VTPACIGVDLLARGEIGRYGVVAGRASVADIQSSGDDLPMFADGELDFVVARHNLEHYVDVVKTLEEWRRVLRPGGALAVVVPDERAGDTVFLDPTHKHCFTPESLERLVRVLGGFEEIRTSVVIPGWSFLLSTRRSTRAGR